MPELKQTAKDLAPAQVATLLASASAAFLKEENGRKFYVNKSTAIMIVVVPQGGARRGLDRVIITQGACAC